MTFHITPWLKKKLDFQPSKTIGINGLNPCNVQLRYRAPLGESLELAYRSLQNHRKMPRNLAAGDFLSVRREGSTTTRFFQIMQFGYKEYRQDGAYFVPLDEPVAEVKVEQKSLAPF